MIIRIAQTAAILFLATLATGRATAQATSADVKFTIPLNLTRLPAEFAKVSLKCVVSGAALRAQTGGQLQGETEIPVTQGEIVQTAEVIVPVTSQQLDNPSGTRGEYQCRLFGFHQTQGSWHDLHTPVNHPMLTALTLTPRPTPITGSFVW